jgi:hypothetical protein
VSARRRWQERIRARVTVRDDTGCWEWQGRRLPSGYGVVRNTTAHRVSYAAFIGSVPADLVVCHACDNPCCVNPAHLWLGAQRDNMQDAKRKGRIRTNGNDRKDTCPRGHPLAGDNLKRRVVQVGRHAGKAQRVCMACHRERDAARQRARRARLREGRCART